MLVSFLKWINQNILKFQFFPLFEPYNDKRTLSMCGKTLVAKFVEILLVHIFRDLMNTKVFCCLLFWNLKKCLFCEKANGILLPKLFWPTVRRNCSSDGETFFEIRGWRPRICKHFEITRTICSNSERSEQFLVTECFFNLFLEVSQM